MNFSLKNDFLAKNGQKSKKITSFRKKFSESIQNVSKRILKQKSQNQKKIRYNFFSDLVIFWPK